MQRTAKAPLDGQRLADEKRQRERSRARTERRRLAALPEEVAPVTQEHRDLAALERAVAACVLAH